MGQNYLRSLLALAFRRSSLSSVWRSTPCWCRTSPTEDDIIMAIWTCVGYTVLLCFTLFKTGSLAKAVFQAH